jgi:hypothetical protein
MPALIDDGVPAARCRALIGAAGRELRPLHV